MMLLSVIFIVLIQLMGGISCEEKNIVKAAETDSGPVSRFSTK